MAMDGRGEATDGGATNGGTRKGGSDREGCAAVSDQAAAEWSVELHWAAPDVAELALLRAAGIGHGTDADRAARRLPEIGQRRVVSVLPGWPPSSLP
ncbi:hypothetical protein K6U06_08255 [Acidiferrimicrobium sp. IK]|uniref:hypothetical protein n=1 Tax=Acidiferrimicrobium sp. IK TaxID=2871700 RepID=UPI0021CAF780|nr:hypothetical protein [Acidiferrimicrobium sp. IK]MCU4184350.1 hypothetical protein [Acidiferrimicrobium sp. IK]